FLGQASSLRFEGDQLVVGIQAKHAFVKTALESPDALSLITEEASAMQGRPVSVRLEIDGAPSDDLARLATEPRDGNGEGRRRDRLLDEALKEPAVRAVMDLFKGQIVDIREGR